ncbi:chemotaxis protein CheW [Pseudoduganella buxea]|uniref:Chemotaxis protein CheW n=1 Tax=Pseudoduganella buxea TaxID=1949069 RepID=A0A6I3SSC5_9BURK|nr:chemotaxis protein CheW [Pseudoduganella buxea]MTV51859.1 chemotaxis protein CheW [Pseudoduganella buxea]GGB98669.1 hypothetical protein GCM10011572_20750 [Pseudoduganella buxea]
MANGGQEILTGDDGSATHEANDAGAPDGAERRSRLRQYQVGLLERVQAAQSGAVDTGRALGVLIGTRRYLLELTQVGEIVPNQPVAAVPLTRDWYLGLTNVRGNLTGVADLARFLGGPAIAPGPDTRLVTFGAGLGFPCALLVSRVLGLRRLSDMTAQAIDASTDGWCAQTFTDSEGQAWQRLDLGQLVHDPRFLHVGR